MQFQADVKRRIEEELARGDAARQAGLEGRARVCARRAAGIAIRAYLEARSSAEQVPGAAAGSAYDLIAALRDRPDTSPPVRQVAQHLLTQVTPGFDLPVEADLLADVRWLVHQFESEGNGQNTDTQERER